MNTEYAASEPPPVTICVLTYGDHFDLIHRCLESIRTHCEEDTYALVVGANAPGGETLNYLRALEAKGQTDRVIVSETNVNKCPMMRRLFEHVRTEYIWWFDDDSHLVSSNVMRRFLSAASGAPPEIALWGRMARIEFGEAHGPADVKATEFVRSASWYRGLTPPSLRLGGKGELNYEGRNTGNPYWHFVSGGSWWVRTSTVRAIDWPDPRLAKGFDDVFFGEAIRQQGWSSAYLFPDGLALSDAERRGEAGYAFLDESEIRGTGSLEQTSRARIP